MDISFVIGNGVSRKKQPLERLTNYGKVYACNYAAVDFPCDHGIAVDRAMIFDLLSQYKLDCTLWSRKKWCDILTHPKTVFPLPETLYSPVERWNLERHWGSGAHAVWKENTPEQAKQQEHLMYGYQCIPDNLQYLPAITRK